MNVLIVYDSSIKLNSIAWPSLHRADEVYLFPLTSTTSMIDHFRALARDQGVSVTILETARLLNDSAEQLRGQYLDFIGNIALDVRHEGKNMREWFAIDDTASMWWLSLVAEKNTFKADTFNRLAQSDAVIGAIRKYNIKSVFMAVDSPKLVNTLKSFMS